MTKRPTRRASISWKARAEELEQQLHNANNFARQVAAQINKAQKAERLANQRQYELNRHLSVTLEQQIRNLMDYRVLVDETCPESRQDTPVSLNPNYKDPQGPC